MTGLETLTAAPLPVSIGGRTYQMAPLTIDDLGVIQQWVNQHVPDFIGLARQAVQGMPAEVCKEILAEAYRDAKESARNHQFGMPGSMELLSTPAGLIEVCILAFKKHHPELSRDVIAHMLGAVAPTELNRVFGFVLNGELPTEADDQAEGEEGVADPKG